MKTLFVCTGNLCRSVMAEYLLKEEIRRRELQGWEARSCGTLAQPHMPVPSKVLQVLKPYGVSSLHHTPRLVNPGLIEWADVILAMASGHADVLNRLYPGSRGKIRLFLEQAGAGKGDVADPIHHPARVYAECCAVIEKGIRGIIENNAKLTEEPRS